MTAHFAKILWPVFQQNKPLVQLQKYSTTKDIKKAVLSQRWPRDACYKANWWWNSNSNLCDHNPPTSQTDGRTDSAGQQNTRNFEGEKMQRVPQLTKLQTDKGEREKTQKNARKYRKKLHGGFSGWHGVPSGIPQKSARVISYICSTSTSWLMRCKKNLADGWQDPWTQHWTKVYSRLTESKWSITRYTVP